MGANDAFLLDAYSQTVSDVVERAGPSVASVRVLGSATDRDAPLGSGSGYLFTPDGNLLTNSHVVRAGAQRPPPKAKRYAASLSDGREFDARWVGDDPDTDLAVLCIDGMSRGSLTRRCCGAARSRSRSATRSASSTP